jgi:hypothetical protein
LALVRPVHTQGERFVKSAYGYRELFASNVHSQKFDPGPTQIGEPMFISLEKKVGCERWPIE